MMQHGGLNGKYANVTANGVTITVPVIIQPGQAKGIFWIIIWLW